MHSYPEWSPLLLRTKFCGPTIIQILIIEWSDFKVKNRHSKCWDKLFETPIPKFWFSMFLFERHKSAEQFLFLCYCTRTVLSVRHQISHPLWHQSSPPLSCVSPRKAWRILLKSVWLVTKTQSFSKNNKSLNNDKKPHSKTAFLRYIHIT